MSAFVELHAQSAFSFLEGAEQPEALAQEAARRGMSAMALVDRDGVYGAARFHRAAVDAGIRALLGSELTLADGARLPLLVEDREGWQNLCRVITAAKLGAPKGRTALSLPDLAPYAGGLVCLTGGAHGPLAAAVRRGDRESARRGLERLVGIFGRANTFVEVQRHFDRAQERDLERLVALAREARVPLLATNQPLYARPGGRAVADVFTCLREKTDLDHAGRRLLASNERRLRDAAEMREAFHDLPDAVQVSGELALRLGFTLKDLGYRFPEFPLPPGESPLAHLRDLTARGVRARYGAHGPLAERARRQVEHELAMIGRLDLAGYFLIVWDIVDFCRREDILVQGRGSAANSAVCYALGITAVDPVGMELLFERFLSESRGEWPDIDLDLPSGDRRERVIQYVYRRYGRLGAGMTANVISYRGRSAAREVGKVLGLPADMQDRLARLVENWGYQDPEAVLTRHLDEAGCDTRHPRIRKFAALWTRLQDLPRHLGQHSGGMVIAAGRLDDVVPLEPATMPGRVVVQWDKDDCAALGIVKVDLLGLRMMSALQEAITLVSETGGSVDLARLPPDDPAVYRMLQRADTIGVFQVESRAQMATLPRIHPERFYDLVVQIAIIRPGPIVGDMVHPYIRRRRGREPVTYAHPSLEPILARTLGVPLFQEQLLRMAMVAAGFTGSEAEELRRAFGFKRSERRMAEVEVKLREGMARQGITGAAADEIVHQVTSFALYGFPECVVGDTRIFDADRERWVLIEDVVKGTAVVGTTLACDSELKLQRRRIVRAISSGRRPVYRLHTVGGREMQATAEHPLLTPAGWQPLIALQPGDRVASTPAEIPTACAAIEWDEVTSVEPAGARETYDLEIEGDHNFLANDLVVHNSHSSSFALLAYASAYLKAHHGPAFYAALLNNQPMGFYHSATVVNDARRHGVRVLPVDVTRSDWLCTLERHDDARSHDRLSQATHASSQSQPPMQPSHNHLSQATHASSQSQPPMQQSHNHPSQATHASSQSRAPIQQSHNHPSQATHASSQSQPPMQQSHNHLSQPTHASSQSQPPMQPSHNHLSQATHASSQSRAPIQQSHNHPSQATHASSQSRAPMQQTHNHLSQATHASSQSRAPMQQSHNHLSQPTHASSQSRAPIQWAVRLGLRYVKGLREAAGKALVAARAERPFASARDLETRAALARDEMQTLAAIGALAPLGGTRRANIWVTAEPDHGPLFAAKAPSPSLAGAEPPSVSIRPPTSQAGLADPAPTIAHAPSPLREMTTTERLLADYAGTGVTLGPHPMALRRGELVARGVRRACDLSAGRDGERVRVAGSVIVRQRPGTAKGFVFLSLEDETGIANVIVTPRLFARQRWALVAEPFLLAEGILQIQDSVVSVRAARVEPLWRLEHVVPSHDFG
jgi:error-prone DNA polymerase